MGEEGEAPPPGYYAFGTTEGEGERNEQKERHGKGTAYFANGDRSVLRGLLSHTARFPRQLSTGHAQNIRELQQRQ
eukprot:COSAG02_NODE_2944_length_7689_cov_9.378920_3_plen_76_part_00